MRTPMPWRDSPGGGFTEPGVQPWLPFGDLAVSNVEGPTGRCRLDAASWPVISSPSRRVTPGLHAGSYRTLPVPAGAWAWGRGDRVVVMVGMSDGEATLDGFSGRVLLGTDRRRDGERVRGGLRVRGWEGVVAERDD